MRQEQTSPKEIQNNIVRHIILYRYSQQHKVVSEAWHTVNRKAFHKASRYLEKNLLLTQYPYFLTPWDVINMCSSQMFNRWARNNGVEGWTLASVLNINSDILNYISKRRSSLLKLNEVTMKNVNFLSISDIVSQPHTSPIWVINNTKGDTRGICSFVIDRPNGHRDEIRIPATWLPINLIERVPHSILMESVMFRTAIQSGAIRLIDNESALRLLSSEGVEEEMKRINMDINYRDAFKTNEPELAKVIESARVERLLLSLDEGATEISILNTLKNLDDLTESELKSISRKAKSLGFERVRKRCRVLAKKLSQ